MNDLHTAEWRNHIRLIGAKYDQTEHLIKEARAELARLEREIEGREFLRGGLAGKVFTAEGTRPPFKQIELIRMLISEAGAHGISGRAIASALLKLGQGKKSTWKTFYKSVMGSVRRLLKKKEVEKLVEVFDQRAPHRYVPAPATSAGEEGGAVPVGLDLEEELPSHYAGKKLRDVARYRIKRSRRYREKLKDGMLSESDLPPRHVHDWNDDGWTPPAAGEAPKDV